MKYQIENARSGIVLGTYDADTPRAGIGPAGEGRGL